MQNSFSFRLFFLLPVSVFPRPRVNSFVVFMLGASVIADPEHVDVRTALKRGIAELRDANVPSYTLAAELLLMYVLGRDRAWLYAHPEEVVPGLEAHRFISLILRRADGEPTQYITGKQEFWGTRV